MMCPVFSIDLFNPYYNIDEDTNWYFLNGSVVNIKWSIINIDEEKCTALAISPHSGKKPRVWTKKRLVQMEIEREQQKEKTKVKLIEKMPELGVALSTIEFLSMKKTNDQFPKADVFLRRLKMVAHSKFKWTPTRANYLINLLHRFEELSYNKSEFNNEIKPGKQLISGIVEKLYKPKFYNQYNPTRPVENTRALIYVRNEHDQVFKGTVPFLIKNTVKEGDYVEFYGHIKKSYDPMIGWFSHTSKPIIKDVS